jgi:DNA-directed RNA polymerase specialized sigma24 family protein
MTDPRPRKQRHNEAHERNAYSPDEIAARNGLSRGTVWNEMKAGRLEYRKVGARRVITRDDERSWLERAASHV